MRDLTDLRAAVVGTGFIGVVHVDALRRLGVQVLGVVGSSPERARAKSGPVPLPEPYDNFEEMLADDRIDVVHLTTPNQLHFTQARAALKAGKHVVCEKPLAIDSEQSSELVELAQRSGLVHCTNFNRRPALSSRAVVSATSGTFTAAISRTGCCCPRTGTGGSSPTRAGRFARSPTSGRTGSTSSSS
jgi:predicted dehydrogenase